MAKKTFTFRLEESQREQLKQVAKLTGLDEAVIVRASLVATLDCYEREGSLSFPLYMTNQKPGSDGSKSLRVAETEIDGKGGKFGTINVGMKEIEE